MSSSSPKRQLAAEPPLYAYAEAGNPAAAASASDTGPSAEERSRRQHAEAFEQGRQSGQQQLRSELDAALAWSREQIRHALQQFALERQSYYLRVEGEVVHLALAIARKILHREVQIDPNTLAGIVRITLEKLDTGSTVRLLVHPEEAAGWREYFAQPTGEVPAPEVHEDLAIAPGECRIETSLGSTAIGLEAQLKEIETGLLDLLAERPGAVSGSAPAPAYASAEKPKSATTAESATAKSTTPDSATPGPATPGPTPETR